MSFRVIKYGGYKLSVTYERKRFSIVVRYTEKGMGYVKTLSPRDLGFPRSFGNFSFRPLTAEEFDLVEQRVRRDAGVVEIDDASAAYLEGLLPGLGKSVTPEEEHEKP